MRTPVKARAVPPGGVVRIVSPASPIHPDALARGIAEMQRQGYRVRRSPAMKPDGYFAGARARRVAELQSALRDRQADAIVCARGGYGSSGVLEALDLPRRLAAKLVIGFSDITALQIYLWQRFRWTSLYGPMADKWGRGAGKAYGYDLPSFLNAAGGRQPRWSIRLGGNALVRGESSGVLLGGCLTLIQTTLGTPWELDTRGALLLIEDVGVKPYQVDRMLQHLAQAGKFRGVRGFLLGDFRDCDPPPGSHVTVREVCRRILGGLGVPVVFGAAVGHTARPMLTVPLGVRGRLRAQGTGTLEILEPAVAVV